ncbi:MAG: type II secretion system F family protein [Parcubacteria group bacterium]|nr:type II secretion system F family protein [Parcubacteria group bacterium]
MTNLAPIISTTTEPAADGGIDFAAVERRYLAPSSLNERFDILLDPIRRVSTEEKIFFTQNLGVMFKSGLAASRALRTLALQTTNPKFKRILFKLFRQVERGTTLAAAMEPYPSVFPPLFTNMIRAGETAGQLEEVLTELTRQMKKSHELKKKVQGALMYPMAILIAMVGIGTAMVIFVIPKLTSIFGELNATLPLPTRILIGVTDWINANLIIVGPAAIAACIGLVYAARTRRGREAWHWLILSLPIIKHIAKKINLAKISRTLGSMLKTDIPIVDSLNLTASVIKNVHYQSSLRAVAGQIEKGKTVSGELGKTPKLYPPVVQQMVLVGEETGEIANILSQLADFYEEEVSQTMDSLPSLIEPVLIIVMGAAVGGMAVAIILPMFSLTQSV